MHTTSQRRRFLCRALRWHDWHTYSTEDGNRYVACTVCHRDHPGRMGVTDTFGGGGVGL